MRTNWLGAAAAVGLMFAVGCGDDTGDGDNGSGASGGASAGGAGGTSSVSGSSSSSASSSAGGSGGGSSSGCFDYSSFTPTADVSFSDDIMPIFAASCNNNNCHGNPADPDAGLYLGETGGDNTAMVIQSVYDNLVGSASEVSTNLQRVVANDAENSWLMIKLDNEMDCPQVECVSNGCGQRMPRGQNAMQLPQSERDLVRSWILNGAPAP